MVKASEKTVTIDVPGEDSAAFNSTRGKGRLLSTPNASGSLPNSASGKKVLDSKALTRPYGCLERVGQPDPRQQREAPDIFRETWVICDSEINFANNPTNEAAKAIWASISSHTEPVQDDTTFGGDPYTLDDGTRSDTSRALQSARSGKSDTQNLSSTQPKATHEMQNLILRKLDEEREIEEEMRLGTLAALQQSYDAEEPQSPDDYGDRYLHTDEARDTLRDLDTFDSKLKTDSISHPRLPGQ
eukprot:GFYU01005087.1.p1 GENE.GFYU01005087.1~~GFYU01005087.1.p1  ORF type:complete len:244 (+),score=59.26 GFYU01005087.1:71-802(+)